MTTMLKKVTKKEEGFTLIELIIVIAILAIIAAVAIPNIVNAVDNARKTTDVTNARIIAESAAIVRAKYEDYSGTTYTTNGLALASCADDGDGVVESFVEAMYYELSSNVPTPSYQGVTENDDFYLFIADDGSIEVYVDNAATTKTYEVYPSVCTEFTND